MNNLVFLDIVSMGMGRVGGGMGSGVGGGGEEQRLLNAKAT